MSVCKLKHYSKNTNSEFLEDRIASTWTKLFLIVLPSLISSLSLILLNLCWLTLNANLILLFHSASQEEIPCGDTLACPRSLCVTADKWWSHCNCSLNGGSCCVKYQQAWSKWVTSREVKCWWLDLFTTEGRLDFFPQRKGDKKSGFRMYRSRNENLVLAAQDCCSRIADHDLCIKFARQSDCGLLGLLCLSFSWYVCSLVSLGLAVTAVSLTDQVSVVYFFCFCVSLCCTTMVLYRYFSRQLFYMWNEIFMVLIQWCSVEKYSPGVIASALRNGKMGHSTEECRRGMIRDRVLALETPQLWTVL